MKSVVRSLWRTVNSKSLAINSGTSLNYPRSPTQCTGLVSVCFHKLNEDFVAVLWKKPSRSAEHASLLFTVIAYIGIN